MNSEDFYNDIYSKRINRFGTTYTDRIQGQREKEFEDLLVHSVYRIDFWHEGELTPGILTKKSQDETNTQQYLLTRRNLEIENGTILNIAQREHEPHTWMVWYKEKIEASGYNRYIMLDMTHVIKWVSKDTKKQYVSPAFFYGQENNMLKDDLKSTSRHQTVYNETTKLNSIIMPTHKYLTKDDYFEITTCGIEEHYRVMGRDIQSTPGVMYLSVDPVYKYDLTPAPERPSGDTSDDYYWLDGGATTNGNS